MLRLTSPFPLSFSSISNPNLPSSFPRPSLYVPNSTSQSASLRINTLQPLSCSISSSVDQITPISQVCSLNHTHFLVFVFIIIAFVVSLLKPLFLLEFLTFGLNVMIQMQEDSLLLYSRAYWVTESVIAWNVDVQNGVCYLLSSKNASLSISNSQIQGFSF